MFPINLTTHKIVTTTIAVVFVVIVSSYIFSCYIDTSPEIPFVPLAGTSVPESFDYTMFDRIQRGMPRNSVTLIAGDPFYYLFDDTIPNREVSGKYCDTICFFVTPSQLHTWHQQYPTVGFTAIYSKPKRFLGMEPPFIEYLVYYDSTDHVSKVSSITWYER